MPAPLADVLPGGKYPLETAPGLTKGSDVFAGWSLTRYETSIKDHIDPTDPADEAYVNMAKSLVASPYTVPAGDDITLYAVYAVDNNGDGAPDFWGSSEHVEYYINGGEVYDGYTVATEGDQAGMFYVCNDYHHPGEDAALLEREYGGTMIYRESAVLIGWSAAPVAEPVKTEDEAAVSITTVTIPTDQNAKVYALWAADENKNSIADYTEETLTHTYHRNEYLSDDRGTTLESGQHLTITQREPVRQRTHVAFHRGRRLGPALAGAAALVRCVPGRVGEK